MCSNMQVKMSVMQYRQSRDTKQFARKLVAAVRNNAQAQTLLPQLAAVVPRNERDTFKAHLQTLVKVLPVWFCCDPGHHAS